MGRIGEFFHRVGRGMVRAGRWVGNNVLRPVARIISHPVITGALTSLGGPIGQGIATAGNIVSAGFGALDAHRKENPR